MKQHEHGTILDYAPEESDPQWVASEFVNPSGFAELSDFPSGQGW